MSIQLGILHILASHPDGFATIASINSDTRMLSGADWSRKLRELSKKAGPINLFTDGLVAREADGWRLTDAGRRLIASLDRQPAETAPDQFSAAIAGLRLVASRDEPFVETPPRARLTLAKSA